jgi:hypothetical protein
VAIEAPADLPGDDEAATPGAAAGAAAGPGAGAGAAPAAPAAAAAAAPAVAAAAAAPAAKRRRGWSFQRPPPLPAAAAAAALAAAAAARAFVRRLHAFLEPRMLRRLVARELAGEVPPKVSRALPCRLSPLQRQLTVDLLAGEYGRVNGMARTAAERKSMGSVVVRLRQVAMHPFIFRGQEPEVGAGGGLCGSGMPVCLPGHSLCRSHSARLRTCVLNSSLIYTCSRASATPSPFPSTLRRA